MDKPNEREATQNEVVQRLRREFAEVEGIQAFVTEFSFYAVSCEGGEKALAYSIRGPDLTELERIGTGSSNDCRPNPDSSISTTTSISSSRSSLSGSTANALTISVSTRRRSTKPSTRSSPAARWAPTPPRARRYDVRIKIRPEPGAHTRGHRRPPGPDPDRRDGASRLGGGDQPRRRPHQHQPHRSRAQPAAHRQPRRSAAQPRARDGRRDPRRGAARGLPRQGHRPGRGVGREHGLAVLRPRSRGAHRLHAAREPVRLAHPPLHHHVRVAAGPGRSAPRSL